MKNQYSVASTATPTVASSTMTYDGENRMASANFGGTGTVTYTSDGDGKRVMKSSTSGTTVYVYDGLGQLDAEYTSVAPTDIGTLYLTADMLGSTRLVTNSFGLALKCYDYMPFGEDIPTAVGPRGSCYPSGTYPATPDVLSEKFTGKERDAEGGLDYFGARYMSSPQGRFTSPDPGWFLSANILNPQTLNLYSYTINNPLTWIDTDGLELVRAILSNGQGVVVDRSIAGEVIHIVSQAAAEGLSVTVTSGFRSIAQQDALYRAYKAGRSKYPAARPGKSGHNSGQSIDISTARLTRAQLTRLTAITAQNGLPYAGPLDAVHFGAGFGVPIDPYLIQLNGIDQPYPDSTIVQGTSTTTIVFGGEVNYIEPVPSQIDYPSELTMTPPSTPGCAGDTCVP